MRKSDCFIHFNLQIPIGEMYHCFRRGRGVHVKGGKMKNVVLRSDCTYARMVKKCSQEIYGEKAADKEFSFYIADSRGIEIWNSDTIEIDTEGSGSKKESCLWSLGNYIKLSGIKYPSKARFFCVKKSDYNW